MQNNIIRFAKDGEIIFESERLSYRKILESDAEDIFRMDSNPDVIRYVFIPLAKNLQDSVDYTHNVRKQYDDYGTGRLAVIEKKTNTFIGWSGIKYHIDVIDGKSHFYELGYRFLPEYWGFGYGSESARAMAKFAFLVLDVPSLAGSAHIEHSASNRLLEKAGFIKTHEFVEDEEIWTWFEISKENWISKNSTD